MLFVRFAFSRYGKPAFYASNMFKRRFIMPLARRLKFALSRLCNLQFVVHWRSFSSVFLSLKFAALSCLPCVGTDTLFDKFWSCGWLFERLGNVCGCEAWAIRTSHIKSFDFFCLFAANFLLTHCLSTLPTFDNMASKGLRAFFLSRYTKS